MWRRSVHPAGSSTVSHRATRRAPLRNENSTPGSIGAALRRRALFADVSVDDEPRVARVQARALDGHDRVIETAPEEDERVVHGKNSRELGNRILAAIGARV